MRSYLVVALTALATLLAAPATAAQAAPTPAPVKMLFDASPEPVVKGATMTLAGRLWQAETGNRARINIYFHKTGTPATAYAYKGFATTTDAGFFLRRYTAETTGTWKATYAGTGTRRNAARLDAVQVYQRRSKQIATWSQTNGNWQSPTIKIPTPEYKALVSWDCAASGFPFINLTWTKTDGYEYVNASMKTGTMTLNGHAGGAIGYFKVSTSPNCAWKVRVFAGIVSVQV
jgi:hypothetical protein